MKFLKFIATYIIIIFFFNCSLYAQNKTAEDIGNAGEVVEKTSETVEKAEKLINSIFGKKKKDKESEIPKVNTPTSTSENSKTIQKTEKTTAPTINANKLEAGSIHPNAVVLDVDKMHPFSGGAAVVQKGQATALINNKGEFIVPFNKYDFLEVYSAFKYNCGIFRVISPKGESGLVNSKGTFYKIPDKFKLGNVEGNYLKLEPKLKMDRSIIDFMDANGKLYSINELPKYNKYTILTEISDESLVPYQNPNSLKWGYKNINNQIIINANFDEAYPFNNDAAVVCKLNEFGEKKYGYLNTKGKIIIPFKFSIKPELFSEGFATIYYNSGDKKWALINKNEGVLISGNENTIGPYYNGYTSYGGNVIDSKGNIINTRDFLLKFGVPNDIIGFHADIELPKGFNEHSKTKINNEAPYILFNSTTTNTSYVGYVNVKSGKSFYGKFSLSEKVFMNFDSTANLALVTCDTSKSNSHNDKSQIHGYINEDGIFMIIKGEASKW